MNYINWKTCKRCGEQFDIGTNYDYCYKCRIHKPKKKKREVQKELE